MARKLPDQDVRPSTLRWRRWNERQSRGEISVDLRVDHDFVGLMLDAGKINDRDSTDRKRIAEAIRRLAYEGLSNALAPSRK